MGNLASNLSQHALLPPPVSASTEYRPFSGGVGFSFTVNSTIWVTQLGCWMGKNAVVSGEQMLPSGSVTYPIYVRLFRVNGNSKEQIVAFTINSAQDIEFVKDGYGYRELSVPVPLDPDTTYAITASATDGNYVRIKDHAPSSSYVNVVNSVFVYGTEHSISNFVPGLANLSATSPASMGYAVTFPESIVITTGRFRGTAFPSMANVVPVRSVYDETLFIFAALNDTILYMCGIKVTCDPQTYDMIAWIDGKKLKSVSNVSDFTGTPLNVSDFYADENCSSITEGSVLILDNIDGMVFPNWIQPSATDSFYPDNIFPSTSTMHSANFLFCTSSPVVLSANPLRLIEPAVTPVSSITTSSSAKVVKLEFTVPSPRFLTHIGILSGRTVTCDSEGSINIADAVSFPIYVTLSDVMSEEIIGTWTVNDFDEIVDGDEYKFIDVSGDRIYLIKYHMYALSVYIPGGGSWYSVPGTSFSTTTASISDVQYADVSAGNQLSITSAFNTFNTQYGLVKKTFSLINGSTAVTSLSNLDVTGARLTGALLDDTEKAMTATAVRVSGSLSQYYVGISGADWCKIAKVEFAISGEGRLVVRVIGARVRSNATFTNLATDYALGTTVDIAENYNASGIGVYGFSGTITASSPLFSYSSNQYHAVNMLFGFTGNRTYNCPMAVTITDPGSLSIILENPNIIDTTNTLFTISHTGTEMRFLYPEPLFSISNNGAVKFTITAQSTLAPGDYTVTFRASFAQKYVYDLVKTIVITLGTVLDAVYVSSGSNLAILAENVVSSGSSIALSASRITSRSGAVSLSTDVALADNSMIETDSDALLTLNTFIDLVLNSGSSVYGGGLSMNASSTLTGGTVNVGSITGGPGASISTSHIWCGDISGGSATTNARLAITNSTIDTSTESFELEGPVQLTGVAGSFADREFIATGDIVLGTGTAIACETLTTDTTSQIRGVGSHIINAESVNGVGGGAIEQSHIQTATIDGGQSNNVLHLTGVYSEPAPLEEPFSLSGSISALDSRIQSNTSVTLASGAHVTLGGTTIVITPHMTLSSGAVVSGDASANHTDSVINVSAAEVTAQSNSQVVGPVSMGIPGSKRVIASGATLKTYVPTTLRFL